MKIIPSKIRFGFVATWICLLFSSAGFAAEKEVFRAGLSDTGGSKSGFDEGVVVKIEPDGRKPVRLNLRELPPHQFLKIEALVEIPMTDTMGFAMMMGGGIDREVAKIPRNRLQVVIDGKAKVLDASFGGAMGTGGSFPDFDDHFLHAPGTGSEHGPLEIKPAAAGPEVMFGAFEGLFGDANKLKKLTQHKITLVIPHNAENAQVELIWKTAEMAIGGEGVPLGAIEIPLIVGEVDPFGFGGAPFSIHSISASVIDEPMALSKAEFESRYNRLSGEPVSAHQALNDLVLAGESILPMLRSKLVETDHLDVEKSFQEALAEMDDPSFQKRAAAAKTIRSLGKKAIPFAKKLLSEKGDELSVETKRTLEEISQELESGSAAFRGNSRTNRLHRLLDIVGGEDAKALKSMLPEPKMIVSPDVASTLEKLMEQMGGAGIEFGFPPDIGIGDPFGLKEVPAEDGGDDPFAP